MANDRITIDAEAFEAGITEFKSCQTAVQNAYNQMGEAMRMLDAAWDGQASEAYKAQYNQFAANIKTSDETIETAIADIRTTYTTITEIDDDHDTEFSALDDTTPFV